MKEIISDHIFEEIDDTFALIKLENTSGSISGSDIIIIKSDKINNLCGLNSINETIAGNYDFFIIEKYFRYSTDNVSFTPWLEITTENITSSEICGDFYFEAKYVINKGYDDYNTEINILLPDNTNTWFPIYTQSGIYTFEKDFPLSGDIEYKIGYGNEGDLYYNTATGKYYGPKINGFWGSPYTITQDGSIFYPSVKNNITITQELIDNTLTGEFQPLDDIILTEDIKFGNDINNTQSIPSLNNNIFINTIYQGFELTGNETLFITHTPDETITNPSMNIETVNIIGDYHYREINIENNPVICVLPDQTVTYKPPMTLKASSICGFEVCAYGYEGTAWSDSLMIDYRWSNNSRKWESDWQSINNYSCIKPSMLYFFYIEFRIHNTSNTEVCINDLIFHGDFQNVSNDSIGISRFGLRNDCTYTEDMEVYGNSEVLPPPEWSNDSSCYTKPSFKPYDFNMALSLYEKLANDASDVIGWDIDYYRVEPDKNGADAVLHEYQTYTTSQKETVKVMIPGNQFPEEKIEFNIFDLTLFDSFEIHITKQEFYSKFGVGTRPANSDYIFMCPINKWFAVEHAVAYKEFNNSSVYYKVILNKKEDDQNISNKDINDFDRISDNSSLDKLFGEVLQEEGDAKINKNETINLTETTSEDYQMEYDDNIEVGEEETNISKPDPIKSYINAVPYEYEITNKSNIISKFIYDLGVSAERAVQYSVYRPVENCSELSFFAWFNIKEYISGTYYNMISSYSANTTGISVDFIDGRIRVLYGAEIYMFDVSVAPNSWYAISVIFDIANNKIRVNIKKIPSDASCSSNELESINELSQEIKSVDTDRGLAFSIKPSPLLISALRVFNKSVAQEDIDLIHNQYIVSDKNAILVDNMDMKVISPDWKQ